MEDNVENVIFTQGWKQFLMGKQEILERYDKAKVHSTAHIVSTSHGNVAEAEFRKWLINFLPKKYGVTSGYIVSQFVSDKKKMPHYDVIIYDALNSPILWIEDNNDNSLQGQSKVIPVEYVKAVFEIKSSFEKKTVEDAIRHIRELSYLYQDIDNPNERYKRYLPSDFFCGLVFMELRKENIFKKNMLSDIIKAFDIRGYYGTIILRGEGLVSTKTCFIDNRFTNLETNFSPAFEKTSLLSSIYYTDAEQIGDIIYPGLHLSWEDLNFSKFAFDVLALLNGTYVHGFTSSFYVHGDSSWRI